MGSVEIKIHQFLHGRTYKAKLILESHKHKHA